MHSNPPPSQTLTRFAPSPTGYLHVGHIASAIYVWGIAARFGASVLLRIEDHDQGRCRPEYERAILGDLRWLGFIPQNTDIFSGSPSTFRQSDVFATYEEALFRLGTHHKIYACTCSRKDIQSANKKLSLSGSSSSEDSGQVDPSDDSELRYPGTCRDRGLPLDTKDACLRIALPDLDVSFTDLHVGFQVQNPWRQCGDLVIRDRHGHWTYQFAVAVDDMRHEITHVIRGADILSSTGRQILLGSWLGRKAAPTYFHHPLIVDESGRKLGKRFFSEAIGKRRADGDSPERILGEAAFFVGLIPRNTPTSLRDLIQLLSGEGICQ